MRRVLGVVVLLVSVLAVGIGVSGGSSPAQTMGIAYVRGSAGASPEVWLADADGRGGHRLGRGSGPLLSPNGALVAASTPDGQGPALTLYAASAAVAGRFFNALRQTATARAWSPDSRYLVVVLQSTDPASDASSGLAVIDAKSGSYRVLAYGTIYGASFARDGSDRIVYARAATGALSARVNIHLVGVDGSGDRAITHDGRSLYPVWGRLGIAFDRERLRRHADPEYQIYLMSPAGTHPTRLTNVHVPPLLTGLIPLQFSEDGTRLLAEYEGANTSRAWAITMSTHQAHQLRRAGHTVAGAAISRDGSQLLIDRGGYLNPPDSGIVETVPFAGAGGRTLIVHGSDPSWNL